MIPKPWTGRLWTTDLTIDNRKIVGQSINLKPLGDLPVMDDGKRVGTVDHVIEVNGIGIGVGTIHLDPGTYKVGIDLGDAEMKFEEGMPGSTLVVTRARLRAVTILREPKKPAFVDAEIIVHEVAP